MDGESLALPLKHPILRKTRLARTHYSLRKAEEKESVNSAESINQQHSTAQTQAHPLYLLKAPLIPDLGL